VVRRIVSGRELVREVAQTSALTLRFACTNVLSLTFFPGWLQRMEAASPLGATVSLVTDNMVDCERLMSHGNAHFLLCHHHPAAPTVLDSSYFRSVDVGQDALVPVSAPTEAGSGRPLHALPGRLEHPVAHLAFSPASGMGRIIASARTSEAPPTWLNTTFTAHLAMVLRMMAREGRGLAWLPYSLVEPDLEAGTLVRAGPNHWDIPIRIRLFRPRARQSAVAEAFWGLVGQAAASGAASPADAGVD
jgi:DNA-binding transcriptional LysR family regulator